MTVGIIGCTSQKLQNRIKQHFSKSNRFFSSFQQRIHPACQCKSSTQPNTQSFLVSDSAIRQRWSRGHKARGQGQGQGHKKNPRPRPRPRTAFQPFRGQTLSRPRTGMLEAKAKDQGHKRKCSPKKKKKKRSSQKLFRRSPKKKKKKVFTKSFQAISIKKRFLNNFSSAPQNFNHSKNSAVLEPRTGQFSRT